MTSANAGRCFFPDSAGAVVRRADRLGRANAIDFGRHRRVCRKRDVTRRIAPAGASRVSSAWADIGGLGRTLAWFARLRRLDILLGFRHLAAGMICLRLIER